MGGHAQELISSGHEPQSERRGTLRPLSAAPMMDRTDRHFRYFLRLLTPRTLLYTEMVTTGAILRAEDRARFLDFDPAEHPIALQLGGDDPVQLAECARIAEDWGYDEVNINIGCPSDRVQKGSFGACLMAAPERVAAGVEAMRAAVKIPVTVKHRIGIDDQDSYEFMERFVDITAAAGSDRFSVHARKAWLSGLSPKQNREIPPLRYEDVYRLKRERPHLQIEINGGVKTVEDIAEHLRHVDAVMIGRAAYDDPYLMARGDRLIWGEDVPLPAPHDVIEAMYPYIEERLAAGVYLGRITRHLLNIFSGVPGAKAWRRHLSENAHRKGADVHVVEAALAKVPKEADFQASQERAA